MSISDISSITLKFNLSPATRVPNLLLPGPEQQEEPSRGPPSPPRLCWGWGWGELLRLSPSPRPTLHIPNT